MAETSSLKPSAATAAYLIVGISLGKIGIRRYGHTSASPTSSERDAPRYSQNHQDMHEQDPAQYWDGINRGMFKRFVRLVEPQVHSGASAGSTLAGGPRSAYAALPHHTPQNVVDVVRSMHGHSSPYLNVIVNVLMHDRRFVPIVLTPFRWSGLDLVSLRTESKCKHGTSPTPTKPHQICPGQVGLTLGSSGDAEARRRREKSQGCKSLQAKSEDFSEADALADVTTYQAHVNIRIRSFAVVLLDASHGGTLTIGTGGRRAFKLERISCLTV